MPCLAGMKSVILQGLLWLYLLEFGFIVESLEPGYLDFDNLPDTNFSCVGKVIGGYYADLETSCQMFHVCTIGQLDEPMDIRFLCLNGTVFDQETRVCERIDEVDCSKSEKFYHLNLELYGNTQPPILEESPETDPPSPQVKSTTTTTTTSTSRPSFYTTSRPVTTSRSKTISSHRFPVDTSPDIRFNPEEINISLNPESPPTIRTKPVSFQQQSFSEDRNKHIIVTHTSGYAAEHKPTAKLPVDTLKIPITTGQPKVSYSVSQSPTPTEINGEFGYQNTEAIADYDTEIPPHNYQYHASVPHFQPTAAEIHPYSELYKSSTYRTLYHPTSTPLKLYHSRATTLRTQNIPKPPPYHYQRTEKATRLPQPLPLYSTLRPLTFSSPAPFSSKRHIDSKRNTDHQVPRIIISSSASGTVVDPTGRILNYSIGDTHMLGRTPPASYDDYKEDDISLDPFYRDVPKLKTKEQEVKRKKRSAKESETILKNEEEEADALKFLLNWYNSYEQTTKIPIPLPSAAITEINNELSSSVTNDTNSTSYDYNEYDIDSANTTNANEISQSINKTTGDIQDGLNLTDFQLKELLKEEIWDELNNNGTDVSNKNNDAEYDYPGEYDDYTNEALNTTDKEAREKERNERYLQYMKLNERISKIFSNDYVDYSGKPLAYLEAFAKSDAKESEDKVNYSKTDSPKEKSDDNISKKDDLKSKVIDDVIDNPLNVTKDNQTAVSDETTKTSEEDDYVDDNYEAQIYEQSSKATPGKIKITGSVENERKRYIADNYETQIYEQSSKATPGKLKITDDEETETKLYVDDNYETQLFEQNSKATPEGLKVIDGEENERKHDVEINKEPSEFKSDDADETYSGADDLEGKNYVSTAHTDVSLTTTENIKSTNQDYVSDDYEDKSQLRNTELPPTDDFVKEKNDEVEVDEPKYENYDHQNDKNFDFITTENIISENANDDVIDAVTQAEVVKTTRKTSISTPTSKTPENFNQDDVEYNRNSYDDVVLAEQTTTTEKISKSDMDYLAEVLLNTEPSKTEEITTEKSQTTTISSPTTDVLSSLVTVGVDTKEEVTPTQKTELNSEKPAAVSHVTVTPIQKSEISSVKPEAVLHRTVTRGRIRFGENSEKNNNRITNLKNRNNSKVYNKFKSRYTTPKHDVANVELKKSKEEQVTIKSINFSQDALRKMAAQAFSLHKKQEATTENIESVINKAISRSKGRFGHTKSKYVEVEGPREEKEMTSTFQPSTQILADTTTEYMEEIFTTNEGFTDVTTPSLFSSPSTESYTIASATKISESYSTLPTIHDQMTTELPATYLQKIIDNVETTTKSIATSILLPTTTIGLTSTSITESNYFVKNDALLTSTEIPTTTEATHETTTTSKPVHTTSRRIGSRGRPYQYSRRTTTPRRSHSHRFDLQSRRRYDRRKSHSEENENSTENKTTTNATFINSSFNYSINNKNSVVPNSLHSPEQQDTSTISVLNTDNIIENFSPNKLEENTDQKEENVTDPSFSKSANPTLAKESKDELSTTPISRFIKIKVRKEKMQKSYVFNCFGKKIMQYYSDPRDCRLFHYCTPGFTKTQLLDMKFVCDLGTYFDDEKLTCTKDKPARCH